MNKWLMLAVLVLMVLVSAIGLRNLTANQAAATPTISASTSSPVPVIKDGTSKFLASTSSPVPVIKDGAGKLFASTSSPVPVIKDGK